MPVSYQFINNRTGKPMELRHLDALICRFTKDEFSETQWCTVMDNAIHSVGLGSTRDSKDHWHADEQGFEAWKKWYIEDIGEDRYKAYYAPNQKCEDLYRALVYRKYTYTCWR